MTSISGKKKGGKTKISPNVKLALEDIITIKRKGSITLQHSNEQSVWVVALGYDRKWLYKSSTWASNKYTRLLSINGFEEEEL